MKTAFILSVALSVASACNARADSGKVEAGPGAASSLPRLKLSDGNEAMRFLEKSSMPLKEGKEECSLLAEQAQTVGALVKKYRRKANEEKSARCELKNGHLWSCEAKFTYNDKRASENDVAIVLKLDVEDATGKIGSLVCFLAG